MVVVLTLDILRMQEMIRERYDSTLLSKVGCKIIILQL